MKKVIERVEIKNDDFVTVTKMGHITEIQYMKNRTPNGSCPIQKLDADTYLLKQTGEIKEFKKSQNRAQNEESLRKTMKKLRYRINNNFLVKKMNSF